MTAQQAAVETWNLAWNRANDQMAIHRLNVERKSRRWQQLSDLIDNHFGSQRLRTVELGSGQADFSVLLAQLGHQVTLVDISNLALNKAATRFESLGLKAHFVQSDFFTFANRHAGRFDLSLSVGVADHFSNALRQKAIDVHAQVLRARGLTFISVPNARCLPYRLWKLYLRARNRWTYGHEAPYTAGEIRSLAQNAGFKHCHTYKTGFAASVDRCLLLPITGRSRGWSDGPRWANALSGQAVNLVATAAYDGRGTLASSELNRYSNRNAMNHAA